MPHDLLLLLGMNMAALPRHRLVECMTIDGTSISGWLYTVNGPAPAIIMSHGVGPDLFSAKNRVYFKMELIN